MFFRRKTSPSGRCQQWLEAYRTAPGQPRQRVVVSLGDAKQLPKTKTIVTAKAATTL
jgi:hypothetical protein